MTPPRRADFVGAALIIGAVLMVAFWPTLLFGQTLASAGDLRVIDAIYASLEPPADPLDRIPPALRAVAKAVRHPAVKAGIYDPAFYWIDLQNDAVQRDLFARGEWPLWNPYVGLGTPLIATGQSGAFFPLKILVYLLPLLETYSAYLLARLFIAGMGTYAFGRAIGLGHWPAILSGIGYMLSGFLVMHFHNVEVTTAALLPLVMWSLEWLVRRLDAAAVAVAGLSLGTLAMAGHPTAAAYCVATAVIYFAARSPYVAPSLAQVSSTFDYARPAPSRPWRAAAVLSIACLIAALFSAPMTLPFAERIRQGASTSLMSVSPESLSGVVGALVLPLTLHLVTPLAEPIAQFNPYVGPLALILAFAALRRPPPAVPVPALVTFGAGGLALYLITRGPRLLPGVPSTLNDIYNVPALAFAMAVLAGCGLETLRREVGSFGWRGLRVAAPAVVLVVAVTVMLWDLSHDRERSPSPLALTPAVVLAAWLASRAGTGYWRRLSLRGVITGRSGQAEAAGVAVGLAAVVLAASSGAGTWIYHHWIGQAMHGAISDSQGRVSGAWTARGSLDQGVWRLNRPNPDPERLGLDAALLLPSPNAASLAWWESPASLSLGQLSIQGGGIHFTAGDDTFDGRITGGFHRFLSPEAGAALVVEVGGAVLVLIAGAVLAGGRFLVGAGVLASVPVLVLVAAARIPPQPFFDFSATPPVAYLHSRLGQGLDRIGYRVAPVGRGVLIPNTNAIHRIRSTGLQDPVQSCRYQRLMSVLNRPDQLPGCGVAHQTYHQALTPRALLLTGARFAVVESKPRATAGDVASPRAGDFTESTPDGLDLSYSDVDVRVYELPDAPGRVWWVPAATPFAADDPMVFTALGSASFEPRERALLELDAESHTPRPWSANLPCVRGQPEIELAMRTDGSVRDRTRRGAAAVLEEGGARLRANVQAPDAGFLVLADADYPGWTATVGGRPVPICRANGALRAIPVDAGNHVVELRYAPLSFQLGLAGAVTAMLSAAGLLVWPALRPPAARVLHGASAARRDRLIRTAAAPDYLAVVGWCILLASAITFGGFAFGLPAR